MNDRTRDYVFFSYSHRDEVAPILAEFENKGYNIVYDDSIEYGKEWDLSVRRYIGNDKCKGIIFAMSRNSAVSKQILQETGLMREFRKNCIVLMLQDLSLNELKDSIYSGLDERSRYIADSIVNCFPPEQLYATAGKIDWKKLKSTFESWHFFSDSPDGEAIVLPAYDASASSEQERLKSQQLGYADVDTTAINAALMQIEGDDLCVLDIGCSNGELTISRFAEIGRITKVIGIDINTDAIDAAKRSAEKYGDKFSFYAADLEDEHILDILMAILKENGREKVDVVFAALVLHHLKAPQRLLLSLYYIFSDDGKIIVRGSDDGGKLCYPNSELLEDILHSYYALLPNSDRQNGRKIYSMLYDAGYLNIQLMYSIRDTCNRNRREREYMYDVGFSFRIRRLNELMELNPDNKKLRAECERVKNLINQFKTEFSSPKFWYCNTTYIAIAGLK